MDRLEAMSIFVSVVELGSFSGASKKLGMPLPTVSRKVSELEAHLKVRLLNRSTRSLELTDVGKPYFAFCEKILEEVFEGEKTVSGEYSAPKGKLIITAPSVFGRLHALPKISEFLKAYPEIDVQLILSDRNLDLLEEHVDIAIRIGKLPDSTMIAKKIGEIHKVVCASPEYFKKFGTPKTPKELMNHNCISIESLNSLATWSFKLKKSSISVPIRSRLTVTSVEAGLDAAVAGVGIACTLSYQVESLIREGKLKVILKEYKSDVWPVHLVYVSNKNLPRKIKAFLEFVTPRIKIK